MIHDYTKETQQIIKLYGAKQYPLELPTNYEYRLELEVLQQYLENKEHLGIKSVKHCQNKQFGEYIKANMNTTSFNQDEAIALIRCTLEHYGGFSPVDINVLPILVIL